MKRRNPIDILSLPVFLTFLLNIDHLQLKVVLYERRVAAPIMQRSGNRLTSFLTLASSVFAILIQIVSARATWAQK